MMAATRYVDGSAELYEVLRTAEADTTILLAPGEYGALRLGRYNDVKGNFSGEVTIRSADPDDPAVFNKVNLREVQNLSFENLVFHAEGDNTAINVRDSSNIAIRNSFHTSDLVDDTSSPLDGLPSGKSISIRSTDGITLEGNEFSNSIYASTIRFSSNIIVRDNEFHGIRIDGLRFGAVENVLIEDNHFHDFVTREGLGDHRDMIQFWTTDTTTPTQNVAIRNNILDSGTGTNTQSIFMRNELVDTGRAGHELFYRDILIENNVIYNAHLHGITVGEVDGLRIVNNTLLHNPDSGDKGGVSRPAINLKHSSIDVTVKHNIAHSVTTPKDGATGWDIADNLIVQNQHPTKANYVGDLFVDALAGGGDVTLASLQGVPGGVVEQGGYGASPTQFETHPDALTALIHPNGKSANGFSFDAGYSANASGFLAPEDASFVWDMGDGTILEGMQVQHGFAPGNYQVTLTVTDRDGNSNTATTKVYMPEPLRLAITATSDGLTDASSFEAALPSDVEIVQDGERFGARIDSDTGFSLSRSAAPIHDLDAFTISFDIKALNGAESAGEIFRLHTSMLMRVSKDGSLGFDITNADGEKFRLRTDPTAVTDGDWHSVSLTYDKAHGSLQLYLDGAGIAEIEASGSTKPREYWGLNFGAVYNKKGFDGLIDGFEIHDTALSSAEISDRHGTPGIDSDEPAEPPIEAEPPHDEDPGKSAPNEVDVDSPPSTSAPELPEWAETIWNTLISGDLPEHLGPDGQSWLDGDRSIIIDLLSEELPGLWQQVKSLIDQKLHGPDPEPEDAPSLMAAGTGRQEAARLHSAESEDHWFDLVRLLDTETDAFRFRGGDRFQDGDRSSAELNQADALSATLPVSDEAGRIDYFEYLGLTGTDTLL